MTMTHTLSTVDLIATYESANTLLWDARLACHRAKNELGHDIVCRIQRAVRANLERELCQLEPSTVTVIERLLLSPAPGASQPVA